MSAWAASRQPTITTAKTIKSRSHVSDRWPGVARERADPPDGSSRRGGEDQAVHWLSWIATHLGVAGGHERHAVAGRCKSSRSLRYAHGRKTLRPSRTELHR